MDSFAMSDDAIPCLSKADLLFIKDLKREDKAKIAYLIQQVLLSLSLSLSLSLALSLPLSLSICLSLCLSLPLSLSLYFSLLVSSSHLRFLLYFVICWAVLGYSNIL